MTCPRCGTRTYRDHEDPDYTWCPSHGTVFTGSLVLGIPERTLPRDRAGARVRPILTGVRELSLRHKKHG